MASLFRCLAGRVQPIARLRTPQDAHARPFDYAHVPSVRSLSHISSAGPMRPVARSSSRYPRPICAPLTSLSCVCPLIFSTEVCEATVYTLPTTIHHTQFHPGRNSGLWSLCLGGLLLRAAAAFGLLSERSPCATRYCTANPPLPPYCINRPPPPPFATGQWPSSSTVVTISLIAVPCTQYHQYHAPSLCHRRTRIDVAPSRPVSITRRHPFSF